MIFHIFAYSVEDVNYFYKSYLICKYTAAILDDIEKIAD